MWKDSDFGVSDQDPLGERSVYYDQVTPGGVPPEDIIWLRTTQISKEQTPKFLDKGAQSNDVIQGYLGDCWLIGAFSVLATNDQHFYSNLTDLRNLTENQKLEILEGVYP